MDLSRASGSLLSWEPFLYASTVLVLRNACEGAQSDGCARADAEAPRRHVPHASRTAANPSGHTCIANKYRHASFADIGPYRHPFNRVISIGIPKKYE